MTPSPHLFYSGIPYEGSPYIIELYDDGSMHIINKEETGKTVIISFEELTKLLASNLGSMKDLLGFLSKAQKDLFLNKLDNWTLHESISNTTIGEGEVIIDKEFIKYQLTDIYKKLHYSIEKSYKEAQSNGKNLLIALGEWHYTVYSFVIELMISKICQDIGITNLMVEDQAGNLPNFQDTTDYYNQFDIQVAETIYFNLEPAHGLVLHEIQNLLALSRSWNVIPIDPMSSKFQGNDELKQKEFASQKSCGMKTRALHMNEEIAKVNKPAFLVVGASHLQDICTLSTPDLNLQYQILAINTCPPVSAEEIKTLKLIEHIMSRLLDEKNSKKLESENTDTYNEYIEEKKSNLHCGERLEFAQSTDVIQIPNTYLSRQEKNAAEAIVLVMNVIKEQHDPSNSSNEKYLNFLEQTVLTNLERATRLCEAKRDLNEDLYQTEYTELTGESSTDEIHNTCEKYFPAS